MFRCFAWSVLWLCAATASAQTFDGFDSPTLSPVTSNAGDWGLKIVVLNVGQADAVLVLTPNGDVCLIDAGKTNAAGKKIADYLASKTLNSVARSRQSTCSTRHTSTATISAA